MSLMINLEVICYTWNVIECDENIVDNVQVHWHILIDIITGTFLHRLRNIKNR